MNEWEWKYTKWINLIQSKLKWKLSEKLIHSQSFFNEHVEKSQTNTIASDWNNLTEPLTMELFLAMRHFQSQLIRLLLLDNARMGILGFDTLVFLFLNSMAEQDPCEWTLSL